jgi:DNA repair protein RadC
VLALVLGHGSRNVCSLDLAREILQETAGLPGLVGIRAEALERRGLGKAKAASVLATHELARRLARAEVPEREPMSRPAEVARYLALRYARRDQEVMGALFLDTRRRLIGEAELFRGALTRASVEPRQILALALDHAAESLALFHTHPSGDPSPTVEDVRFTRRMAEACAVVGVRLVDHIILGGARRWVSLQARGLV